ncbi:MAG: sulfurtransferase [Thalassolituus sp.]|jgi:rhodanese-related sulfurtransferase|uniref:Rhodanese-like domain-containing protein n=1 Tax=Thalassolituus maritimus TaxID=484498 RepID=A0ABP9ZWE5_9GAMM|nr:rhodanese-like domain-containing protein [Pseudomonadota bacterium]MEC8103551.1 rhodanese-like domain-containing protein [Pseudomonadota bacterium]MEC8523609.1 rhodanese-like domain-containing protein [Pseudomonadota bacterium]MEE2749572.1 rhodanese-like domain-containing protein [Pseudomonadota bacterium]TNC86733.1 MAG: sulfurtransferase [Thalassolituus sp.]|tara:strand:- start:360 stop:773 length:414 start_codon:yes stop_codon:yes gene_type:complete
MDQYIEFAIKYWWLVAIWVVFLVALLWDNNRRNGQSVSTTEATTMINRENAIVLDIREKADFKTGHLVNAINIPFASLSSRTGELEKYRKQPIVLVCKSGQTVGAAGKMLREQGFNTVRMKGGMMEWNSQNLPVVKK